ncbi:FAD-dependent oxidoreductase [Crystallibacter degradans]|uniref:FAD-dependent oxidoreductase n=1 Tax=Crystallibacter degradans TaxID=2726743 RepID=UPI00147380FC|nr:FAD-dependent monooxygenase [Arthrobacter sp. SF27]NMR32418.1 FAD-dependent monooxygenase [Arthrobacter sp. SF27]
MLIETDVLIVGAGPAGLTMSALLASYGVDAVTVTRYASTANSPRAHITNQRTMEVFRDLGIEERVRDVATPNHLMTNNVWATSFAGQEIARLHTWGTPVERKADYEAASPSSMCNVPQHILEPQILAAAIEREADIRFSTELVSISQNDDGVTATVRNRETGETDTVRAKYAVGADGARSTVADQLGFPMKGETGLGAALNIWLEADLTKYCEYRPGTLYWMAQPGNDYWVGSGTWINVKPFTEWVLLCMYDPAAGEPDISEEALIARAHQTIGDAGVEVKIKAVSKWQINHMVAETYQQGRVFLAGDAAHRHPPANGLGSNTSVQDSFNLAWKLAAVVSGRAGAALLESYTQERQPVGEQVVDRAMKSVQDMAPISQALGFTQGQSSEDGWSSLKDLFAPTAESAGRRDRLAEAVQLQNYQFNAHGVELGQQYRSNAVIDDGTAWPESDRDPQLYYRTTTKPGAPIPHAWVQQGTRQVSTLDAVGKGRFTLVTGIDNDAWRQAAAELSAELGIDLDIAQICVRGDYDDVLNTWTANREIGDDGCLLVRPDRVIAWRQPSRADKPAEALRTALTGILHR